jgi:anaerobic magnesium-protoporphyrin IX monomethyl ester cyclase
MLPLAENCPANTTVRVVLLNPPHTAIGSRVPDDHLPPLGLLAIGGPLLDAGYPVQLLDADYSNMRHHDIIQQVTSSQATHVLIGHSGSSSVHPTVMILAELIKKRLPDCVLIYGGVYPTYHYQDILQECPAIDFVVRGEGEQTCLKLLNALTRQQDVMQVDGIAFRQYSRVDAPLQAGCWPVIETPAASMIRCLDDYRVGWELIDFNNYSYWGGKRAVVAQFSRGCPYLCSYCGQRGFWTKYRHRDPVKFARELANLHRQHGVELINLADELPTGSRKAWKAFLLALIAENVNLLIVGSTRTSDIVRDAEFLHLYKQAGVIRFLLGIESYNESTLAQIKKGASMSEDYQAIRLLRQHGILSMATYVIGFSEEQHRDFYYAMRHLLAYDPDQIQILYATPHRWVPFYDEIMQRQLVQLDTRYWDYKHQVIDNPHIAPWLVFLWSKLIEAVLQGRWTAWKRVLFSRDKEISHAMRWYTQMGRRVWLREWRDFLSKRRPKRSGIALADYYGNSLSQHEYALGKPKPLIPAHSKAAGRIPVIPQPAGQQPVTRNAASVVE